MNSAPSQGYWEYTGWWPGGPGESRRFRLHVCSTLKVHLPASNAMRILCQSAQPFAREEKTMTRMMSACKSVACLRLTVVALLLLESPLAAQYTTANLGGTGEQSDSHRRTGGQPGADRGAALERQKARAADVLGGGHGGSGPQQLPHLRQRGCLPRRGNAGRERQRSGSGQLPDGRRRSQR